MMPIRVEQVDNGEWESWCTEHPLSNGDTGVVFSTWFEALEHANQHAAADLIESEASQ